MAVDPYSWSVRHWIEGIRNGLMDWSMIGMGLADWSTIDWLTLYLRIDNRHFICRLVMDRQRSGIVSALHWHWIDVSGSDWKRLGKVFRRIDVGLAED